MFPIVITIIVFNYSRNKIEISFSEYSYVLVIFLYGKTCHIISTFTRIITTAALLLSITAKSNPVSDALKTED